METLDRSQLDDTVSGAQAGLVASLLSISKSVRALMGLRLAELGLHPGQDELLLVLKDGTPQPVSQIAERLNVRASTMSKMKDRLKEQQLLSESTDAIDARNTWVQLTPSGQALVARIQALHHSIHMELTGAVNGDAGDVGKATMQIEEVLARRLRRIR
ncbi:MarR family winged helix-turn-helix transcriptional regulator [Aureimonas sp. AU4]|uniref:MarR family winged helix-turn-helix transcriptional regulator n=1 Tax=Aureimonas sp. AU4 TaxID=1638163 RepID=UPI000783E788|nr:winged helix DNA-binding protein [Aureimonas sp. AU4]